MYPLELVNDNHSLYRRNRTAAPIIMYEKDESIGYIQFSDSQAHS